MYFEFARPDVLNLIPADAKTVLDIGCGSGQLGAAVKARQECEVWGIEQQPGPAQRATEHLDNVLLGNVEDPAFPWPDKEFDCVVCADVLEHLHSPVQLLVKIRGLLAEPSDPDEGAALREPQDTSSGEGAASGAPTVGGKLIVSVPNMRNWQVLVALAEGNFAYEPAGLLDWSHLRFFTRCECEKLFDECWYNVYRTVGVKGAGYDEWDNEGRPGGVNAGRLSIQSIPEQDAVDLFVYQWLFVASKRQITTANGRQGQTDAEKGREGRTTNEFADYYGLTAIVMLTCNTLPYTQQAIQSIRKHTRVPYHIILVDNGSEDNTVEWAKAQGDIAVIANTENLGFPAGNNQGIRVALERLGARQVLLLNNDVLVTPGWLRHMIECLREGAASSAPTTDGAADKPVGLVGPRSNFVSGAQVLRPGYRDMHQLDGWAWEWSKKRRGEYLPVNRLVGFCLLIDRPVIETVGLLDERFGLGNFEDDDYCRRAEAAGFRLVIANDSYIHHFGQATFRAQGIDFNALMAQNKALYEEKWAGEADNGRQRQTMADSGGEQQGEAGQPEDKAAATQETESPDTSPPARGPLPLV